MKRWYTREEYIELICKIKTKIPDCAIGADVIVGFPGEGGKEFLNTYELIKSSPISRLHIFRYSKRPNTYALSLPDEPPPMIKKERSLILQKLSAQKWEDFRKQFVDKIFDSHVEKETKEGWSVGVTKNYIKIFFKPKKRGAIKKFVNLRIKRIEGPFTYGEIVDENNCSP
jgi:threonylcarbamoyladenosine tRNA methylthiotransferase MtaB